MGSTFDENKRLEDEFMMQLAKTIESWQWVEQVAFTIYNLIMKGADKRAISVSWHSIQSFDSRVTLLDRCIFFLLDDKLRTKEWKPLKKRLVDASNTRNAIVHSSVGYYPSGGISYPKLGPSHFDATAIIKKRANNPDHLYDTKRLGTHRNEFKQLHRDLSTFRDSSFRIAKKMAETNPETRL